MFGESSPPRKLDDVTAAPRHFRRPPANPAVLPSIAAPPPSRAAHTEVGNLVSEQLSRHVPERGLTPMSLSGTSDDDDDFQPCISTRREAPVALLDRNGREMSVEAVRDLLPALQVKSATDPELNQLGEEDCRNELLSVLPEPTAKQSAAPRKKIRSLLPHVDLAELRVSSDESGRSASNKSSSAATSDSQPSKQSESREGRPRKLRSALVHSPNRIGSSQQAGALVSACPPPVLAPHPLPSPLPSPKRGTRLPASHRALNIEGQEGSTDLATSLRPTCAIPAVARFYVPSEDTEFALRTSPQPAPTHALVAPSHTHSDLDITLTATAATLGAPSGSTTSNLWQSDDSNTSTSSSSTSRMGSRPSTPPAREGEGNQCEDEVVLQPSEPAASITETTMVPENSENGCKVVEVAATESVPQCTEVPLPFSSNGSHMPLPLPRSSDRCGSAQSCDAATSTDDVPHITHPSPVVPRLWDRHPPLSSVERIADPFGTSPMDDTGALHHIPSSRSAPLSARSDSGPHVMNSSFHLPPAEPLLVREPILTMIPAPSSQSSATNRSLVNETCTVPSQTQIERCSVAVSTSRPESPSPQWPALAMKAEAVHSPLPAAPTDLTAVSVPRSSSSSTSTTTSSSVSSKFESLNGDISHGADIPLGTASMDPSGPPAVRNSVDPVQLPSHEDAIQPIHYLSASPNHEAQSPVPSVRHQIRSESSVTTIENERTPSPHPPVTAAPQAAVAHISDPSVLASDRLSPFLDHSHAVQISPSTSRSSASVVSSVSAGFNGLDASLRTEEDPCPFDPPLDVTDLQSLRAPNPVAPSNVIMVDDCPDSRRHSPPYPAGDSSLHEASVVNEPFEGGGVQWDDYVALEAHFDAEASAVTAARDSCVSLSFPFAGEAVIAIAPRDATDDGNGGGDNTPDGKDRADELPYPSTSVALSSAPIICDSRPLFESPEPHNVRGIAHSAYRARLQRLLLHGSPMEMVLPGTPVASSVQRTTDHHGDADEGAINDLFGISRRHVVEGDGVSELLKSVAVANPPPLFSSYMSGKATVLPMVPVGETQLSDMALSPAVHVGNTDGLRVRVETSRPTTAAPLHSNREINQMLEPIPIHPPADRPWELQSLGDCGAAWASSLRKPVVPQERVQFAAQTLDAMVSIEIEGTPEGVARRRLWDVMPPVVVVGRKQKPFQSVAYQTNQNVETLAIEHHPMTEEETVVVVPSDASGALPSALEPPAQGHEPIVGSLSTPTPDVDAEASMDVVESPAVVEAPTLAVDSEGKDVQSTIGEPRSPAATCFPSSTLDEPKTPTHSSAPAEIANPPLPRVLLAPIASPPPKQTWSSSLHTDTNSSSPRVLSATSLCAEAIEVTAPAQKPSRLVPLVSPSLAVDVASCDASSEKKAHAQFSNSLQAYESLVSQRREQRLQSIHAALLSIERNRPPQRDRKPLHLQNEAPDNVSPVPRPIAAPLVSPLPANGTSVTQPDVVPRRAADLSPFLRDVQGMLSQLTANLKLNHGQAVASGGPRGPVV